MLDDTDARILELLRKGPGSSSELGRRLGISRQAAHARLRRLVEAGRVVREGAARATRYRLPGAERWERRFPLEDLREDDVFRRMAAEVEPVGALTGEGLFFASKAVEVFRLESGGLAWIVDNRRGDTAVAAVEPPRRGTRAVVEIDLANVRSLSALFEAYTEDYEFAKTRIVIRLFSIGVRFVSRSEARRLLHGLERFREVVLDFRGVEGVGQGFADEVFRVWARAHPETSLLPVHMNEAVELLVTRARRQADKEGAGSPFGPAEGSTRRGR